MHVRRTDETKSKARSHLQARKLPTPCFNAYKFQLLQGEGKDDGELSFFCSQMREASSTEFSPQRIMSVVNRVGRRKGVAIIQNSLFPSFMTTIHGSKLHFMQRPHIQTRIRYRTTATKVSQNNAYFYIVSILYYSISFFKC